MAALGRDPLTWSALPTWMRLIGTQLGQPLAILVLLGLCFPRTWAGELCSHWTPQAGLVLIAIAMLWRRAYLPSALMMILGLAGVAPAWTRGWQPRTASPTYADLTVASGNLFHQNPDRPAALRAMLDTGADLVALLECGSVDQATLKSEPRLPYRVWGSSDDNKGTVLLSRFPLVDTRMWWIPGNAPMIQAGVMIGDKRIDVLVIHPISPVSPDRVDVRNANLREVIAWVDRHPGPVVVMGDFNLSRLGAVWPELLRDSGLCLPPGPQRATWPVWLGPLGIDIDHILAKDARLTPLSLVTIPGSDHRGLRAGVALGR